MKYLYNGIECIALPEWDKEKFPCVVLVGIEPQTPSDSRPLTMYAFQEVKCVDYFLGGQFLVCEPSGNYYTAYVYKDEWQVTEPSNTNNFTLLDYVFWTNTDIYNEDGTLYLAASEPVPVLSIDHTAMVQGWIVGKRLAAMRGKKQPTAFLYNGVRLPALPEWDKTVYPYAVIRFVTSTGVFDDCYIIEAYPVKPITIENTIFGSTIEYIKLETASSWLTVGSIDVDGDTWDVQQTVLEGEGKYGLKSIVWSNFDINHVDGTAYLAASEPVPVYD